MAAARHGHCHQHAASRDSRAQPPLDNWVRISIGLPEENATARKAVAELLPPA
jgi:histidinol-phosphate/aromatic aminotransferase/cobyric acid decarboxylase-like protein